MKCIQCGVEIRYGRYKNSYCSKLCESKLCEIKDKGYSPITQRKLDALGRSTELVQPWWNEKPEHIISERVGILCDVHCPFHSKHWLALAISVFKSLGIKDLIIAGDFIDLGTISQYAGEYYKNRCDVETEIKSAAQVLGILCEEFERVHVLIGNHETRAIRKFGGEISIQSFYKMIGQFPNLIVSGYSFCYVNDSVVVGHPRQYSRIRGAVAQRISQLWQKSVALAHEHHSALSVSADNRHQAVAVGCIADIERIEHSRREINDMPRMANGFAVVISNLILTMDKFTPFELFLK